MHKVEFEWNLPHTHLEVVMEKQEDEFSALQFKEFEQNHTNV